MTNDQNVTRQSESTQKLSEEQLRNIDDLDENLDEIDDSLAKIEKSGQRLPFWLFIATFLGSLLGFAADLSDASGLVIPILEVINPAPALRIVGSNTILGEGIAMSAEWQHAFEQEKAWESKIPVIGAIDRTVNIAIEGIGTVRGIEEAREGNVNLLAASEPLTQKHYDTLNGAGLEIECAAEIGYDVIAFITDINNSVPEITTRDMASVLDGSITNWAQVGGMDRPIRILARRGSGTTEIVLRHFTGSGEFRDHFIPCDSNSQCLDAALSTPGSLYWVSTAWLRKQPPRYLRLILVRRGGLPSEDPLKEQFDPDSYTLELMRPLYMYFLGGDSLNAESTALAKDFLYYVRGVQGQEILEENLFYTYFDPPSDVEVALPPGFGLDEEGLPVVCR